MNERNEPRPQAVLVGVQMPGVSDEAHAASLAELGRLVHTLGYTVKGTITQRRDSLAPSAVLGEGKLEELAALTGGDGVVPQSAPKRSNKARERDLAQSNRRKKNEPEEHEAEEVDEEEDEAKSDVLVAVDHEISPSQARNLEQAAGATVLDRTGVIVEIFHRHAKSREAKLQVEIARLAYMAPRLRAGSGGDRQQGGIGGKGTGESALELDRRRIRDRIAELKTELEVVAKEQSTRRSRRREARRVALVGYTNAGKSSLMRALTGSEVLVADKLFATLDTTVRALHPEVRPRILVSDTVGFIKKLPHDLVASFRSTLDEAHEASLLMFVVDASDPTFREQFEVTRSVLSEIGTLEAPQWLLLNKCDRLSDEAKDALAKEFPEARMLSAHAPGDVKTLHDAIVTFFDEQLTELDLVSGFVKAGALAAEAHARGRVIEEVWGDEGLRLRVRVTEEDAARLRAMAVE